MSGKIINLIRKRDGRLQEFNEARITEAAAKAFAAVGDPDMAKASEVTDRVVTVLKIFYKDNRNRIPSVEEVQDLVELKMIEMRHSEAAKAFILYRDRRAKIREGKSLLDEALELVDSYVGRSDWRINENSNMDYSLQGLNNYISSSVISKYWLAKIYTPEIKAAHEEGWFHVHDLGLLSVYCCGWDLQQLLLKGFRGAFGKVASSPPKHFRSALGQIVNFFYTMQGESAGAQAFSNFDTLLAPFIRYDGLDYEDVKQAMQGFVFNLNIPTRVGFQTPFTNLTMDLQPCPTLADEPVLVGGERRDDATYSDFQHEMDLINRAFAEVMMEGDESGRIFTFPIPTYNLTPDFDWDNPKLASLWQMTSKFGIPYFANFINSDMKPEDARSMCCRLRLDKRELLKRGGGLFGSNPLTGSIGVVTINLPRIGYTSNNENEFFANLDRLIDLARESLDTKRKVLETFTAQNLYPYSKYYLADMKKAKDKYWANHFSTIGLIGMHECCLNHIGAGIDEPEGREFALKVLQHMRSRVSFYQESSSEGVLYNLEATPGEGTAYRLARLDTKQYPDIISSGEDEPYYTNSTQLPVSHTDDVFEALTHQEPLQTCYTGGTVFHGFIGERIEDPEVCKKLVKKIAGNFSLPYFTISPTFTICPIHGYIPGEHFECPREGAPDEESVSAEQA